MPLLNTAFKSNFNTIQTFESWHAILKLKQLESNFENKYLGIKIYLYEYNSYTKKLSTFYKDFNSINELSNYLGIGRETINIYLNTYVPYKNNLFLTDKIESIELVENLVNGATLGLELDRTIANKIWMYYLEKDGTILKTNYESIGIVAKLLGVQHKTRNDHLDKWIIGGISGNYFFTYELNSL